MSGVIYAIRHTSGRCYIGQSASFRERRWIHLARLRGGTHPNKPLQDAFAQDGEAAFSFEILEHVEPERLTAAEARHIREFSGLLYNKAIPPSWDPIAPAEVGGIDIRAWERPSPDQIRGMVESLRDGRSMTDTAIEIAARLGMRSHRALFHWMSPKQEPGREISYCEWLAFKALCEEMR